MENAIRHGIGPVPEGGEIMIEAQVVGGSVVVTVSDDGRGAQPSQVEESQGIGLRTLRDVLRVRFGEDATLDVCTAVGRGFDAKLSVPSR